MNYKKEWVHFLAPFLGPRFFEIWVRGGYKNEGGHTEKGCTERADVSGKIGARGPKIDTSVLASIG